jgi:putative DNA primase/helicase
MTLDGNCPAVQTPIPDAAAEYHRQCLDDGAGCLAAALDFLNRGLPPLALCPPDHVGIRHVTAKHAAECKQFGKTPWVRWKQYQTELPDADEVRRWWAQLPNSNVGMVLGFAGTVGIDCDGEEGARLLQEESAGDLPPTWQFRRGAQSTRHLYRMPDGIRPRTAPIRGDGEHEELRFLGFGSQTVMPPSRHKDGDLYEWLPGHSPSEIGIAPAPPWLVAIMRPREGSPSRNGQPHPSAEDTEPGPYEPLTEALRKRIVAYLSQCPKAVSGHGGHKATLWAARCVVRGFNLGPAAGYDLLAKYYNPRCEPEWSAAELRHKCAEADEKPFDKPRGWLLATDHDTAAEEIHLTDLGNAQRVAQRHGPRVRYPHPLKKWLTWDAQRWAVDDTAQVTRYATETLRSLFQSAAKGITFLEGAGESEDAEKRLEKLNAVLKHCLRSEAAPRVNAMLDLLRSQPGIPILPGDLDRDPCLLNCINGTLELKTGTLREHRRDDYLTKLCPVEYQPSATCPKWERFLDEIMASNRALVDFLQRLFGYFLTADVSEQILPILWGTGANGKSTLLNTILAMLGPDYAMKAPPDLLMAKRGDSHPTERADLFGRRLVVCSETEDGQRLAESLAKDLTGGDKVRARRMREDFWEFSPTHKIVLATNHKPTVRGTDHAIWRRLCLIPFAVTIPPHRQDKQLPEKLRAELPGILAWCVRGCLTWQAQGLNVPAEVKAATQAYQADEDLVGRFLTDCCRIGRRLYCRARDLYRNFAEWCVLMGESPILSQRNLGEALKERGYSRYTNNGTWYRGLDLRSEVKH